MNVDEYQTLAARTLDPKMTAEQNANMALMGMIGELGEFTELIKKQTFHGKIAGSARISEEAGDFLWYVALVATARGVKLSEFVGVPDFRTIDEHAARALADTRERFPDKTLDEIVNMPSSFYTLAQLVSGQTSFAEALITLAVILSVHGGIEVAAVANIEKLERRHGLPSWRESVTTTPGGNE